MLYFHVRLQNQQKILCLEWILYQFGIYAFPCIPLRTMVKQLRGCVRYILTSLFCMPEREDLWNKEKCFLFHFVSFFHSFCFWDNQILNFQIFKCHDLVKCLSMKNKTYFIEWLGKQTQSGNEIWPGYVTLKDNFFLSKNSMEDVVWKLVPGPF